MKRISLLTLVVVAAVSVNAQDPAMGSSSTPTLRTPMASVTRFGLKAGVNSAMLNPNQFPTALDVSTNRKTSFFAGAFVNVPLGGVGRFQPELLYSRQGSKISQNVVTGSTTTKATYEQDLGYISIPLMFQVQTAGGFLAELGPQFSYLIGAKQNGPGNLEDDNEGDFDKVDVGAGLGIGFMSRVGLGINARYNFGLANILKDSESDNDPEYKNRVIQVGLFYQIGANK